MLLNEPHLPVLLGPVSLNLLKLPLVWLYLKGQSLVLVKRVDLFRSVIPGVFSWRWTSVLTWLWIGMNCYYKHLHKHVKGICKSYLNKMYPYIILFSCFAIKQTRGRKQRLEAVSSWTSTTVSTLPWYDKIRSLPDKLQTNFDKVLCDPLVKQTNLFQLTSVFVPIKKKIRIIRDNSHNFNHFSAPALEQNQRKNMDEIPQQVEGDEQTIMYTCPNECVCNVCMSLCVISKLLR